MDYVLNVFEPEEQYLRALPAVEAYEIRDGKLRITAGNQLSIFEASGKQAIGYYLLLLNKLPKIYIRKARLHFTRVELHIGILEY